MRPTAPSLLGLGAALVGAVSVVSALTPELAARFDFVRGVLPPGVPDAARVLVLAFGVALVWLSRSLARRRRRAWELAVGLVVATAAAHLAKGLDFEEACVAVLLLGALWRYRSEFDAPGDPASLRPLARDAAALAALGGLAYGLERARVPMSERLEEAAGVLAVGLGFRLLYLWLRPLAERARQTVRGRAQAERLVHDYGRDSLCFFALRRDKSYFFSPSERSFLAYRVVGGCALATGDPIGEPDDLPVLVGAFRAAAAERGWRAAFLGVSRPTRDRLCAQGMRSICLGEEAVLRPDAFSLEGRAIRKVRQSVARLGRAGYRARVVPVPAADARLRAEIARVSDEWRGRWPERGFTMAMDSIFGHREGVLVVAADADGRLGGFVHLVPSPASGGYSLATMRRCRSTPNGLMEFLVVEAAAWARSRGVPELSLNFTVFADVLRADASAPRWKRAARVVVLRLDRLFQLERLDRFSRKFRPEWRPRYLVFERWLDFPLVGVAFLRAEALLTPPGPWARTPEPTAT